MSENEELSGKLEKMQRTSFVVGMVLMATFVLYGFMRKEPLEFFQSYMIGYLYALGATLGGLGFLFIHHLTGGGWGHVSRRIFEAASRNIYAMGALFIPVIFFMKHSGAYPWVDAKWAQGDHVVAQKLAYLTTGGFTVRAIIVFAIFFLFTYLMNFWSKEQDRTGDMIWRQKMKFLAGPALLIYVLAMTVAAIDWVMSLEPTWFSSIYGVMFCIGQGITILAFNIVFITWLAKFEPMKSALQVNRLHDIGNLQFAFIILWAYIELSQFIIIWSANLPEEITWYMNRSRNGFQYVTAALIFLQFVFPFLLLISRGTKRVASIVSKIAIGILCVRLVDLWWIVAPSVHPGVADMYRHGDDMFSGNFPLFFSDLIAPLGFAALWFALFLKNFRTMPVLATKDPAFPETTEQGGHA
jgi:hypothetical protein